MDEVKISPLARRLAEENSIDWRQIRGTGPEGRVVERDILTYLARVMSGEVDPPAMPDVSEPPPSAPPPDPNVLASMMGASSQALRQEGIDVGAMIPTPPPASQIVPDLSVDAPPAPNKDTVFELDLSELEMEDPAARPVLADAVLSTGGADDVLMSDSIDTVIGVVEPTPLVVSNPAPFGSNTVAIVPDAFDLEEPVLAPPTLDTDLLYNQALPEVVLAPPAFDPMPNPDMVNVPVAVQPVAPVAIPIPEPVVPVAVQQPVVPAVVQPIVVPVAPAAPNPAAVMAPNQTNVHPGFFATKVLRKHFNATALLAAKTQLEQSGHAAPLGLFLHRAANAHKHLLAADQIGAAQLVAGGLQGLALGANAGFAQASTDFKNAQHGPLGTHSSVDASNLNVDDLVLPGQGALVALTQATNDTGSLVLSGEFDIQAGAAFLEGLRVSLEHPIGLLV